MRNASDGGNIGNSAKSKGLIVTLVRLSILIALISSSGLAAKPAQGSAQEGAKCAEIFSSVTLGRIEFPIQWSPGYPDHPVRVLSDIQLHEIFKEAPKYSREYGRRALGFMKALPKYYDSETRAQIWMEMAIYIVTDARTAFVSDLYILPGNRFLFRGGLGETLFIDTDGATYRTRTESLYYKDTWVADYSRLSPL